MSLVWQKAAALVIVTVTLAAAGCGRKSYGTPQDAFNAMKAAAAKEDYRDVLPTMTSDSQKMTVATTMQAAEAYRQFAQDADSRAKIKPIEDVLKKHGLTDDVLKNSLAAIPRGQGDEAEVKALGKVVAPIKDYAAFLTDMRVAMKQVDGPKQGPDALSAFKNAELRDVKTSGDTATGTAVVRVDGTDRTVPFHFRKEGGGWKIDFVQMRRSRDR